MNSLHEAGPLAGRSRLCLGRAATWFLVALLAAALGGYGYWRYVYYPTTPQYALDEFLSAARDRRYPQAYARLHVTAPLRLVVPSAEALERLAENAGGLIPRLRSFRLGKVERKDDTVTIATTLITDPASGGAQGPADTTEVAVEMRMVDEKWKVDGGWALRELIDRGGADLLRSLFQ
ncbi:MAG: hypothetical protein FJX72_03740 [Armatimonadetes bacterium]|nr:hypothetical protein [Armatimonadota bacterium]